MRGRSKWLNFTMVILALAFALGGCAQSTPIQQHEKMDMAPEPSGQDTNWSLYEDQEGVL